MQKGWPLHTNRWDILGSILWLAVIAMLAFGADRSDFHVFSLGVGVLFAGYFWVLTRRSESWPFYLGVAVLARLILLFAEPWLSDDIFRFIWDGHLWQAGINPFTALPSAYAEQGFSVPGLNAELYEQLNSAEYFTIYPPIPQGTFWLSVWLFPDSIQGATLVQRLGLLAAEVATIIWLLPKTLRLWGLSPSRTLLYALNPLVILEIVGNIHHEGYVVFFMVLALYGFRQKKWIGGGLALAGAVCAKLLPLMFAPFLWRRAGFKNGMILFTAMGLAILLAFWPLYDPAFFHGFRNSIDLYFRRFEFNASIFYIIRWIGFELRGYDIIRTVGPELAKVVLIAILALAALERRPRWANLPGRMLAAITIYLALATTVHPWYLTLPIFLCCFTRFRFPVVWSVLIMGTYINYSYPEYRENMAVVAIEYVVVYSVLLWEIVRRYRGKESWLLPKGETLPDC
jgi:hypothetical protein